IMDEDRMDATSSLPSAPPAMKDACSSSPKLSSCFRSSGLRSPNQLDRRKFLRSADDSVDDDEDDEEEEEGTSEPTSSTFFLFCCSLHLHGLHVQGSQQVQEHGLNGSRGASSDNGLFFSSSPSSFPGRWKTDMETASSTSSA